MIGRALAPYPPVIVSVEGAGIAPANVVNSAPIDVVWKKRDRLNAAIVFPTDADETVEAGTEYVIRHGIPGFITETVLGDDTDTTGSFNFDFKGFNTVEIFARRDGYESQAFSFTTTAANGNGASVVGDIPDITVQMLITAAVTVNVSGALGTIQVQFAEPANATGDIGTITMSAIDGSVAVEPDAVDAFPIISLTAPSATVAIDANATGSIGTITMTAPSGSVAGDAATSGALGTITLTAPTGVGGVQADAAGDIGTITMTAPTGSAMGSSAVVNQEYIIPGMGGVIDLDTTGGQFMAPLVGAIHDE